MEIFHFVPLEFGFNKDFKVVIQTLMVGGEKKTNVNSSFYSSFTLILKHVLI